MIPEERLTAYALDDPGMTAADRAAVEATVAADPAAKRAVEEVRELAGLLSAGFAAELAAANPPPVTVPSEKVAKPRTKSFGWIVYPSAAAIVVFSTLGAISVLGTNANRTFTTVGSAIGSADASRHYSDPATASVSESAPPIPKPEYDRLRGEAMGGAIANKEAKGLRVLPAQAVVPPSQTSGSGRSYASDAKPTPTPSYERPAAAPQTPPLAAVVTPGMYPSSPTRHVDSFLESETKLRAGRAAADEYRREGVSGDRFPAMIENDFIPVEGQNALSTFGVDVDTASYAIARNYLNRGQLPPKEAVRLEEIVNYFPYQDKPPQGDDPFAVTVEVADCPWRAGHRLARIGLKTKPIDLDKRPPSNLVFLIDVSGSMNEPNKLPLVKAALKLLVGQLGENDRVAMVVYAGAAGMVLDSTSAVNKGLILEALDRLQAGGSTNGSGGLQQAYELAAAHFIRGGTNRVILCTDGDWNVGTTGTDALVQMIEEKRKTGVFLSVFGFGMGNLRDEMMVKLAGKGNGNYGYIDTIREAHKALVEQISGTLVTVAKDVKIQVEFNPAAVRAYRLLGYEKRALAARDFADDTKDAGEMGAGHVVTALYELVPADAAGTGPGEGLRYQPNADPRPVRAAKADEAFLVKMRHKKPDGDVSTLRELPVPNAAVGYRDASEDFRFAAAAAEFALVLRDSAHKGTATLTAALGLAESATRFDPNGYRAEFVELIRRAKALRGE